MALRLRPAPFNATASVHLHRATNPRLPQIARLPPKFCTSSAALAISQRPRHSIVCSAAKGDGEPSGAGVGWEKKVEAFGETLSAAFPLWVVAASVAAMLKPAAFNWLQGPVQMVGLAITMLGMGITMTFDDLRGAMAMPKELLAGVALQYTVMPTAGALISRMLNLPPNYAAGLILVACCPGGTASNVVTYLARGNVALSVLMTAASTFLAIFMTPILTSKLVGQYVAVDAGSLFFSTLQASPFPYPPHLHAFP